MYSVSLVVEYKVRESKHNLGLVQLTASQVLACTRIHKVITYFSSSEHDDPTSNLEKAIATKVFRGISIFSSYPKILRYGQKKVLLHWDESLEFMWPWKMDSSMLIRVDYVIQFQTLLDILALSQDRKRMERACGRTQTLALTFFLSGPWRRKR